MFIHLTVCGTLTTHYCTTCAHYCAVRCLRLTLASLLLFSAIEKRTTSSGRKINALVGLHHPAVGRSLNAKSCLSVSAQAGRVLLTSSKGWHQVNKCGFECCTVAKSLTTTLPNLVHFLHTWKHRIPRCITVKRQLIENKHTHEREKLVDS